MADEVDGRSDHYREERGCCERGNQERERCEQGGLYENHENARHQIDIEGC